MTASRTPVTVHVTVSPTSTLHLNVNFTVTHGVVHRVEVSPHFRLNQTQTVDKTIEITPDKEIIVYEQGSSFGRRIPGPAHRCLRDGVLHHIVWQFGPHYFFNVLATEDSTQVSFKLINNTQVFVQYKDHSYTSNQWIDVTMNKFDVFLIHSKGHLTGSYVVASRPVGDISGNKQQGYGTPENRLTISRRCFVPSRPGVRVLPQFRSEREAQGICFGLSRAEITRVAGVCRIKLIHQRFTSFI